MEESGIIFLAIIATLLISWAIAEFFGRAKHIGFGWTFALSATTAFIGGIIALLASPSAKNEPTSGGKGFQIGAWVCFVFGALNIIMLNPLAIGFFVSGAYLYKLSNGEVMNSTPKFYFENFGVANTGKMSNHRSGDTLATHKPSGRNKNKTSTSNAQKSEYLKSLHEKGLLDDKEFYDKTLQLKETELEEKVKTSNDFRQLENLFFSGVLTKKEMEQKTTILRERIKTGEISDDHNSQRTKVTKDYDAKEYFISYLKATLVVVLIFFLIWIGNMI